MVGTSRKTQAKAKAVRKKKAVRKGPINFDKAAQKRYLASYKKYGLCHKAAEAAGVSYQTVYLARKRLDDFVIAEQEAHEYYKQSIIQEVITRAIDGIEEPVYGTLPGVHMGTGVVGTKIKKSDALLQTLLLREDKKYQEAKQFRKVDQTVTGSVATTELDTSQLTPEDKRQLLSLLQKAKPKTDEQSSD